MQEEFHEMGEGLWCGIPNYSLGNENTVAYFVLQNLESKLALTDKLTVAQGLWITCG